MCGTILLSHFSCVDLPNPRLVQIAIIPLKSTKVCWLKPAENLNSLVCRSWSMWTSGMTHRSCFGDVERPSCRDCKDFKMFCRPQLAAVFKVLSFFSCLLKLHPECLFESSLSFGIHLAACGLPLWCSGWSGFIMSISVISRSTLILTMNWMTFNCKSIVMNSRLIMACYFETNATISMGCTLW